MDERVASLLEDADFWPPTRVGRLAIAGSEGQNFSLAPTRVGRVVIAGSGRQSGPDPGRAVGNRESGRQSGPDPGTVAEANDGPAPTRVGRAASAGSEGRDCGLLDAN